MNLIEQIKGIFTENKGHIPNIFWMFLYTAGKQVFVVVVFFMCAWMLDSFSFGLYTYLTTVLLLLVLFSDFGISTSTSKMVAESHSLEDHQNKRSVLFNATFFSLFFSLLTVLGVLIFAFYFSEVNKYYFLSLIPSLVFSPLVYIHAGAYRGIGKFKDAAAIMLSVAIVCIGITYFLIDSYGLIGALWGNNIFSIVLFLTFAFFHVDRWIGKFDFGVIKSIGIYSFIVGASSLGAYVYGKMDILLLAHFDFITEIGFYELLSKAFMLLVAPSIIISQVIAPKIAGFNAQQRYDEILRRYKQLILGSIVLSVPLTALAYFLMPIVLDFYFPQYSSEMFVKALYLMLIMLVTQSAAMIASTGFSISTGNAKLNLQYLVFFGLINIPFTYVLILKFGFLGAIYATVIIRCVTDILFIRAYYRVLKRKVI